MLEALSTKELRFTELLSMSAKMFVSQIKSLFLIALALLSPVFLINASILIMEINGKEGSATYGWLLILFLISVFTLLPLGLIALTLSLKNAICGTPQGVFDAIKGSAPYFGSVLCASLMLYVFSTLGYIVFYFPGVYLTILWTFYHHAVVLEGKQGLKALNYSASLVKNNWWNTFGMLFALGLCLLAIMIPSLFLGAIFNSNLVFGLIYTSIVFFASLFYLVFITLFYYNRVAMVYGSTGEEKQEVFLPEITLQP